jgi:hypothetical protein
MTLVVGAALRLQQLQLLQRIRPRRRSLREDLEEEAMTCFRTYGSR